MPMMNYHINNNTNYKHKNNLHSISFDPHVTLVIFKQYKWFIVTVILDGHGSQEVTSKPLLMILLFFSQMQCNPFKTKNKVLLKISYNDN